MVDIRRILCPVDASLTSHRALEHAITLAGWYGSRLTALHVNSAPYLPQPPILFAEGAHPILTAEPGGRDDVDPFVDDWLAGARAAGIDCEAVIESSHNPSGRILHCAETLPADMIVLGTHGRGGFERLMLGSVAEKVLRKARCPVLTVPPPAVKATKLPFKRLLCPVDFSDPSLAALQFALSIAKESDAHLTLLHAIEWPVDDDGFANAAFDNPEYRGQLKGQITERLDALVSDDERIWCDLTTSVTYGKAYERIVETAEHDETDLIVMGVHGRNAIELMLFGSTTNQTV
ncbi:MAG TPA: universal stress protein, partial [Polyangiaceae bacterium]